MATPNPIRLGDITRGGHICEAYQDQVLDIAKEAAHTVRLSMRGSMVSTTETRTYSFLDGGVTHTRGSFRRPSGLGWFGTLATAYILYELGANPCELLADTELPSRQQLAERVLREKQAAQPRA
jgi:hypothetical protein